MGKVFLVLVGLLLYATLSFGQRIKDYPAFSNMDSIQPTEEWQYYREYYPSKQVSYELRYKKWGDGCAKAEGKSKCNFFIQEQMYYANGVLNWKHGIWGSCSNGKCRERQIFKSYSENGDLRIRKKSSATN